MMIFFVLGVLAGQSQSAPARVEVQLKSGQCAVAVDGVPSTTDALAAVLDGWAEQGRPVDLSGPQVVPYRCIGGVLFVLQGRYRVGSGDAPKSMMRLIPRVTFGVEQARACRYTVNERRVSEAQLGALMAAWKRYEAEVRFVPNPYADYGCVEQALRRLRQAGVTKLGFIGNEAGVAEGE